MSSALFPGTLANMPGLAWNVGKSPLFNTKVQTSVSNKELRATFTPYPVWTWTLTYTVLRQGAALGAEYETLFNFWLARQGMYDSFLYSDPSDNTATAQAFGVGDGAATTFQLQRAFNGLAGGFNEYVYNPFGVPAVSVNGTPLVPFVDYNINNGLVTFTVAPAGGAVLTWTGTYAWRVRFADDSATPEQFANLFWQLRQLRFVSILGS